MSSKPENTSQKCTKNQPKGNQSKEKQLKDRIDELEGLCLHCVSMLCEADYDDGNHPVVWEVIELLRAVYLGD